MGKRSRDVALGAVIAGAAGYVVGILSAPRSGKQTRKKLAKSASKARTDAEKELKKLYKEINAYIEKAEKQITKAKTKANEERKQALKKAQDARQKVRLLLSALRDGDVDEPDLKAAIADARKAKTNLGKFIRNKDLSKKSNKK